MKSMENKSVTLPVFITEICAQLEEAGYASYAVGGCVRDILMGRTPGDYDVTTAASPEEIQRIFPHSVPTGLAHGTVTVLKKEGKAEVTTFRQDGQYSDKRRPDSVTFVSDIETDLARRDFTVNAMAFSSRRGFCDPFGGQEDVQNKCLRAVGDPRVRFSEDALRILRLYRFSAQLSFSIEQGTAKAAAEKAESLSCISAERVFSEITKLLRFGTAAYLTMAEPALRVTVPEADLSEETLEKVAKCASEPAKWALLCGENVGNTLRRLHASRTLFMAAEELAAYKKGKEILWDTAKLRHATPFDLFAYTGDRAAEEKWKMQVRAGMPQSLGTLAVTGRDAEEIGFSGKEIGKALERVFMYVIENPGNNKKETLKEVLRWIYRQEI